MTITQKLISSKVAVATVGAVVALGLLFTFAAPSQAALSASQIQSILSLLQSFGADATTIANVQASLNGTAPTTPSTPSTPSSCPAFTRDLTIGSSGADVKELQKILNANGFKVADTGAGSPGSESEYFGAKTQAALAKWQASVGISPAAGYFGPLTRAKLASSCTSTGPSTPTPTGTGLAVGAGSQPANSLAPEGAMRVPFTRFTLTAGNDGDVQVTGVVIQRVGFGSNASFNGVVLLDENGMQLGTAKTFNSNHQATVGEKITIAKGTTKTFTVAGNMASSLDAYAGEAPAISIVSVNTGATVTGSLPITGAYHTINSTLTTGAITFATSTAYATNVNATKEIGTTGYKSTGFRLTASSAEDLRLRSLRINQVGSVGSSDLANVAIVVNGTSYPATVSADGKYFETVLGSGVVITKGNNVEVYVSYDIVGSGASGRSVRFFVEKSSDVYATGETYGYGASVSGPNASGIFYAGETVTVSGASVTTIGKSNTVAAQNVAPNVSNQPLGGFEIDLKGEAITAQSLVFTVATSGATGGAGLLTQVTLVDANGSVVAGPVDATYTSATTQTVTFTDSVTFPTGKHVYTLRGKISTSAVSGQIFTASTNPNTGWTNVKGDTTGNSITLTQTSFSMNAMTVKAGTLAIGPATSPASQNIVPGGTSVLMSNIQLDATQSGEDVRVSSIPARLTYATGAVTELTSCQIFDGSTALSTGSNVVNPSGSSPADSVFVLDNSLVISKGTVKTVGVRCNVSGNATNNATFSWTPGAAAFNTSFSVSGVASGSTLSTTAASGSAVTVTISSGSAVVALDASSPSYMLAAAGSSDNTVGAFKFTATNEAVNLQKVGLFLTNTASSSSSDLVKVSLYDGATKVGEAFFTGSNTTATSTLSSVVVVPKNGDKVITVKADFSAIGTGEAVTTSGHLVAVDYLNAEGTGGDSGATVFPTDSAAAVSGARVMKSYPTVAIDTLPTTGIADGRLMRFKVTANAAGPISLTEFNLKIATTTASVTNINIYGYTDSNYSNPVSGVSTDGAVNSAGQPVVPSATTALEFTVTTSAAASTTIQVPAGGTRYFEVRGTVTGVASGASITTTLVGDSSFHAVSSGLFSTDGFMQKAASTTFSSAGFIWSPNSTTSPTRANNDWTNGFGVTGLPTNGLINTRSN